MAQYYNRIPADFDLGLTFEGRKVLTWIEWTWGQYLSDCYLSTEFLSF